MTKKRISTQSAKAKGRKLQQWVCQQISDILGIPYGKDELIASREMGQAGTDVRLIGQAQKDFPFSVECKNQQTWSIPGWIRQAKENTKEGTDWLLVVKRNWEDPVAILNADTFFEMINCLHKYKLILNKLTGKDITDSNFINSFQEGK